MTINFKELNCFISSGKKIYYINKAYLSWLYTISLEQKEDSWFICKIEKDGNIIYQSNSQGTKTCNKHWYIAIQNAIQMLNDYIKKNIS